MVFLDCWGYPIERAKGHWLRNILRLLIYTRRICRGHWNGFGVVKPRAAAEAAKEK